MLLTALIILWSEPPINSAVTLLSFSGLLLYRWSSPESACPGQDLVGVVTSWETPCGKIRANRSSISGLSLDVLSPAGRLGDVHTRR